MSARRRRQRAEGTGAEGRVALVEPSVGPVPPARPRPVAVPELVVPGPVRMAPGPPRTGLPGLDDVDPLQLRAVQEALLDPSLILRAKRLPVGTVVDFVCEDANEAACASLEVPMADLIGASLTTTLPGELGVFLFEQCVDAVETGAPLSFDDLRTSVDEDGSASHYDVRAVAVGDRVCFSWRNVSERFRTQEALAESRNRYRLLAENSSDVVVLVRADGVVEWVSPAVSDMLGWEPAQLVGHPSADFVHPDDHRRRMAVHRHPGTVQALADEVRCRRADGDLLWVSSRMRDVRDDTGRLLKVVVSLRDVHKQVQARQAMVASEERYRLLAENVSDVVYQVVDGRITWISPSVEHVLGWRPDEIVGRLSFDLIAPEDLERAEAARSMVVSNIPLERFECRFLTRSGSYRWMRAHSRRIDAAGGTYGLVTGLQDVHEGHVNRMAMTALAAVNAALVVAGDEPALLDEVCRLVVAEGGFVGARFDRGPLADTVTPPDPGPLVLPMSVDGAAEGRLVVWSGEPEAFSPSVVATFEQLLHQVGMACSRIRTRERLLEALNEQELLSTAIEQAGESVVVTGLDARILYANPATASSSGYSLDEIIGASPRLFASGLHGPEFFRGISEALGEGRTWRGVVVNRTKGGGLYEEDTTITPIRGDDGAISSFVSVRRNISRERKLEADLDRLRSDRDSVVQAMGDVRVGATIEATAASFCEAVAHLEDLHVARILLIEPDGTVVPLGVIGPVYLGWEVGVPVTMPRLPELIELTRRGTWWLTLDDPGAGPGALVDPVLLDPLRAAGFRSVGFAAIWWEGRLVGVLAVASRSPENDGWRESRTGLLDELSSFAGQVLGTQASRRSEHGRRRDEIRSIVDQGAFRPVFQPVVDLATGEVLGHEALTRFDSARRPDLVFEDAHAVGLGTELETACALTAVRAAVALPAGGWLAVNFSPASAIAGAVSVVVAEADRPVVVEVTEHVEVQSYGSVRAAIASCPGVRISVDDAGAGYASLRHILELQPDFVKLDIGLVHNIDTDPARQALAAGLRHYADQTGTTLIAEGVETLAERDALARLGVPLAQGYLFGRPGPADGPLPSGSRGGSGQPR